MDTLGDIKPSVMRSSIVCFLLLAQCVWAQPAAILHTDAADLASSVRQLEEIRATGARVTVVVGPGWYVVHGNTSSLDALRATHGMELYVRGEEAQWPADTDHSTRVAMALLGNDLTSEPGIVPSPGFLTGPPPLGAHTPGSRSLEPPVNYLCHGNSEIMSGTVLVTNVVVESNGAIGPDLLDWGSIENTFASITRSLDLLANAAFGYGATLTFVSQEYYSEVSYEPTASVPTLWMTEATRAFTGDSELEEAALRPRLNEWNAQMRVIHGVDHAVTGFIAAGTAFADGILGWGDFGGPLFYTVLSVYPHELSHTFHALDEHPAAGTCSDQFNGVHNGNDNTCEVPWISCIMGPANTIEIGIVEGDSAYLICPYTAAHVGWTNTLEPADTLSPEPNVTLYDPLVHFTWENQPGVSAGFLRIVKLNEVGSLEDDEVICAGFQDPESHMMYLVNGKYRWAVGTSAAAYAEVLTEGRIFMVDAPLHANFWQDPPAICANDTIQFTDMSTGAPNSWEWTFPGGEPSSWSGRYPPPVVYDTPGIYAVSLVVGDGAGEDEEERLGAVTVYETETLPYQQTFNELTGCGWGLFCDQNDPLYGTNWQATDLGGCGEGVVADGYTWNATAEFYLMSPLLDLQESTHPVMRIRYSYRSDHTTNEELSVRAYTCGSDESLVYGLLQGMPIDDVKEENAPWTPDGGCEQWNTVLVDLSGAAGSIAQVKLSWGCTGNQAFYIDQVDVFEAIRVKAKVLLDGPYDPTPHTMKDDLRPLLTVSDPYAAGSFPLQGNWEHAWHYMHIDPVLQSNTGDNAIVDWVVLELRRWTDPAVIIASRPCLVQRDGDLMEVDGITGVWFDVPESDYYVSVRHRNHLGCMSSSYVPVNDDVLAIDFSLASTSVYGTNARKTVNDGRATLWCGDVTSNHVVKYTGSGNDANPILVAIGGTNPTNTLPGVYRNEDVNMNGVVKYTGSGNDRDRVLLTVGNSTPNNVRTEQVP